MTALVELRQVSFTRSAPAFGSEPDVVLFGRRHLTAALSTTCEVEELPLTFPVAPRARSGWWPAASRTVPRIAPTPCSSKRDASSTQNAFRRRMPLEGPPGCPEDSPILLVCRIEGPATGLAASPPRSGFRRLFASRALSRCGARPTFVPTALRRRRRCGPDVVRRLLQSRRFASTTTVRSSPAPPRARSPVRSASPGPRSPLSRRARSQGAGGRASCPTSRSRAPP